jgi:hypothetical protein
MEVLSDKSFKSHDYINRYTPFPYYFNSKDNRYIYGTTAHLNQNTGYSLHTVKKNDTLDSIALNYYNSPTLFWVIADFNNIQDPFKELIIGSRLKIPVLGALEFKMD